MSTDAHIEEHRRHLKLARYGVPGIILIFYITAAMGFSFTPDGTFLGLQWVHGITQGLGFHGFAPMPGSGSPSPLWVMLVSIGTQLHLNPILLAKILSLSFCCAAIFLSYLLAYDITNDPLLALCVALLVATNGLLLQTAPSGTPHAIFAVAVLGALFSTLRSDYLLASISLGLACLLAWQAVVLVIPFVGHIWLSARTRSQRLRVLSGAYVALTALMAPWVIYALRHDIPWLTELPPSAIALANTDTGWIALTILGAGCLIECVALLVLDFFRDASARHHLLILGWLLWLAACALLWDPGFLLAALPLAAAYALASARLLAYRLGKERHAVAATFVLTALLLFFNQADLGNGRRAAMADAENAVQVQITLASKVKGAVPDEASLGAEWPGLIGYVAARPVTPLLPGSQPWTDFAITSERPIAGYTALYSGANSSGLPGALDRSRFLLWKRQ